MSRDNDTTPNRGTSSSPMVFDPESFFKSLDQRFARMSVEVRDMVDDVESRLKKEFSETKPIETRFNEARSNTLRPNAPKPSDLRKPPMDEYEAENMFGDHGYAEADYASDFERFQPRYERAPREPRRAPRRERKEVDDDLSHIKMTIPPFQGRSDPEAYLEWEKKMELIFDCHNYSEDKKVKLAMIEFTDYAIVWWDQLVTSQRRNLEAPIRTWADLKRVMRKRFMLGHYFRDIYQKLQTLTQGSRSVEDYYKDMEIALIRANVQEDREATMARFLSGLNRDIAAVVDLHHYVEMEDLVHMAMKVERQRKWAAPNRASPNTPWKPRWGNSDRGEGVASKSRFEPPKGRFDPPKPRDCSAQPRAESTTSSRNIKCFKCLGLGHMARECPNKRVMITITDGGVDSASDSEDMPDLVDANDDNQEDEYEHGVEVVVTHATKGKVMNLVTQRALNAQMKIDMVEQ